MGKKVTKTKSSETSPVESAAESTPSENASPEVSNESAGAPQTAPDLTLPTVKAAIEAGQKVIADGGTKADAARAMFDLIANEPKELVVAAFVAGATLTEKGALTYWYNCKRKASKSKSA